MALEKDQEEIVAEFDVACNDCDANLDADFVASISRSTPTLYVTPCEKCGDVRNIAGYNEGYDEGQKDANL